jgi:hypothetical protein
VLFNIAPTDGSLLLVTVGFYLSVMSEIILEGWGVFYGNGIPVEQRVMLWRPVM